MNGKVAAGELEFVTRYPHLSGKLCEALTDAIRAMRLEVNGYSVSVAELTDPENTPKNTLIRAIKKHGGIDEKKAAEYKSTLKFVLGDGASEYLKLK